MKLGSVCATCLAQNAVVNDPYIYTHTLYVLVFLICELQVPNNIIRGLKSLGALRAITQASGRATHIILYYIILDVAYQRFHEKIFNH
jgi:hypothetical protein